MYTENKKTLTIVIPTWNRARYLEKNLEILDSYLQRGLDFKILVCNNGSTDNTNQVLEKYINHPKVRIINHPENIKFDRNVASGYLNFDTDFCFCLGDSKTLSFESLAKMITTINEKEIDAIIIKTSGKINQTECFYSDINSLMLDLGWSLTNISACVISKKFVTQERCERYYDSLYIHFAVFADALCTMRNFKVKYCPSIEKEMIKFPDELQPHGWSSNVCTVWGKYWQAIVLSLPWKITLETKIKVIKDANKFYRFLSPGKFVYSKINRNIAFFKDYEVNRKFMPIVSDTPLIIYDIISAVPSFFYLWMRPIFKIFPKYGRNIM